MIALTNAYGLSREPFAQDIPIKDLYPLPGLESFLARFDYAIAQRLVTVITGEVGAGKSTSLRAAVSRLHPSQYCVIALGPVGLGQRRRQVNVRRNMEYTLEWLESKYTKMVKVKGRS